MAQIVSSGRSLHTPESYTKRKRRRKLRLYGVMALFIMLVICATFLLSSKHLLISEINVYGADIVKVDDVKASISSVLDGHYIWVLPKRNLLLYPRKLLMEKIMTDIPRIKSAKIGIQNLRTLDVVIEERTPFALHCTHVNDEMFENCYFLDDRGFIFSPAPTFSWRNYFIYSKIISTESVDSAETSPINSYFMEEEEFKTINQFITEPIFTERESVAFEIDSISGLRLKYSVIFKNGGRIIWNAHQSLELIRSNLETFIFSNIVESDKDFFARLQYIDLRTDNKVFYKLK
jgi:hypothetical protein